ncbi:hypothetical protein ACP4OV_005616 [Aristida adscensionis]
MDPKELKKQRDRERYARNREEILRRQRERYHQKKAKSKLSKAHTEHLSSTNLDVAQLRDNNNGDISKENIDPNESSDWLHRNDSYMRPPVAQKTILTACDLTPISMVDNGVNVSMRMKSTFSSLQGADTLMPTSKLGEGVIETVVNTVKGSTSHVTGKKHPRDGTLEQEDIADCTPNSAMMLDSGGQNTIGVPDAMAEKQRKAKRAKERAKYARMTDEKKQNPERTTWSHFPLEQLPPPPIPNLGPDDDDDYEGVVLDDDSDDEGYLFAGQEESKLQEDLTDEMVELGRQLKESSLLMNQSVQETEKILDSTERAVEHSLATTGGATSRAAEVYSLTSKTTCFQWLLMFVMTCMFVMVVLLIRIT